MTISDLFNNIRNSILEEQRGDSSIFVEIGRIVDVFLGVEHEGEEGDDDEDDDYDDIDGDTLTSTSAHNQPGNTAATTTNQSIIDPNSATEATTVSISDDDMTSLVSSTKEIELKTTSSSKEKSPSTGESFLLVDSPGISDTD